MVQPIAIPGERPGEVFIPALNRSFQQVQLTEDDIIDTEDIASGSVAADTKVKLFDNMSGKNEQHSALVGQNHKLMSGDEAAIFRIGFHIRTATGTTRPTVNDMKAVIENGSLQVKFNRRVITEGPLFKYPSGYGLTGNSTENNVSLVTLGTPSVAGAPVLFVPQQLKSDDDINATVSFPSADWIDRFTYTVISLSAGLTFSVIMRAVLTSPLGK